MPNQDCHSSAELKSFSFSGASLVFYCCRFGCSSKKKGFCPSGTTLCWEDLEGRLGCNSQQVQLYPYRLANVRIIRGKDTGRNASKKRNKKRWRGSFLERNVCSVWSASVWKVVDWDVKGIVVLLQLGCLEGTPSWSQVGPRGTLVLDSFRGMPGAEENSLEVM